jgi:hypothetical protein
MMKEIMRLVKWVEELEASDRPGDLMEICIKEVPLIQPAPNYVLGLLDSIS